MSFLLYTIDIRQQSKQQFVCFFLSNRFIDEKKKRKQKIHLLYLKFLFQLTIMHDHFEDCPIQDSKTNDLLMRLLIYIEMKKDTKREFNYFNYKFDQ